MGVKERQEREREAVSRAILDAARDLFVSEGYQQVSIRKIAERIEYSPAAIYSYFPSKDDIFFALAEEGFHLLFSSADLETEGGRDALDAVRAPFCADVRRSIGAATQSAVGAFFVRGDDEGAYRGTDPAGHRRGTSPEVDRWARGLPHPERRGDRRRGDAAV